MNNDTFYNTPLKDFTFVPGDIETTGFYDDDIITTFTIEHDDQYVAWLNTNGRDTPRNLSEILTENSDHDVTVRPCDDDGELLIDLRRYIDANFDRDSTIFTFYNGETYRGGFDLRFIRSVCLRTGAPFPFAGYSYLDIMPIFGKHNRFNVTHVDPNPDIGDLFNAGPLSDFADHLGIDHPGSPKYSVVEAIEESAAFTEEALTEYCEEHEIEMPDVDPNGLVPVYQRISSLMQKRDNPELVRQWSVDDCDPFEPDESVKAVHTYHEGRFGDVLLHNIADVHKTGMLADVLVETDGAITRKEIQPTHF